MKRLAVWLFALFCLFLVSCSTGLTLPEEKQTREDALTAQEEAKTKEKKNIIKISPSLHGGRDVLPFSGTA